MHELIESLTARGPVVTDGAWGTQLQARGLDAGACPDAWNLSHADRVEEVARAYVEAGSQAIITNTFRATRFGLKRDGVHQPRGLFGQHQQSFVFSEAMDIGVDLRLASRSLHHHIQDVDWAG